MHAGGWVDVSACAKTALKAFALRFIGMTCGFTRVLTTTRHLVTRHHVKGTILDSERKLTLAVVWWRACSTLWPAHLAR
jgi:hypothetical protein